MQKLTVIPFQGFYNSIHDSLIDQEIESVFDNDIPEDFYQSNTDYHGIFNGYAKEYAESFDHWFTNETGINLALKERGLFKVRDFRTLKFWLIGYLIMNSSH